MTHTPYRIVTYIHLNIFIYTWTFQCIFSIMDCIILNSCLHNNKCIYKHTVCENTCSSQQWSHCSSLFTVDLEHVFSHWLSCPWDCYHRDIHCVKSVHIRSYSGPYFSAFVSLFIQSECGKMWTRITPNTDTFHVVIFRSMSNTYDGGFLRKYLRQGSKYTSVCYYIYH